CSSFPMGPLFICLWLSFLWDQNSIKRSVKMKLPKLSIITVNYNGFTDTVQLIESIQTHLGIPCELIVVDNGSKADEAGMLKHQFPNIKVIRSDKNLGFAGGNNLGIEQSTADFLFFINNDAYVKDDSLTHLVERMKKEP